MRYRLRTLLILLAVLPPLLAVFWWTAQEAGPPAVVGLAAHFALAAIFGFVWLYESWRSP